MTRAEIEQRRRDGAILTEVEIIEAIPQHSFTGAQGPNLLGGQILRESIERIRQLIKGEDPDA
jgi:hypothetical protein